MHAPPGLLYCSGAITLLSKAECVAERWKDLFEWLNYVSRMPNIHCLLMLNDIVFFMMDRSKHCLCLVGEYPDISRISAR